MSVTIESLFAEAKTVYPDVVGWRRHLHSHPELSFVETATAKYITEVLTGFACPQLTITHPVPTAVVADLQGGAGEGPTVALRADIDALALQEDLADLDFHSVNDGVMHACGHDAHTAMALGACKVLCGHVSQLRGRVRFVFQHAEEKHPGGAVELVRLGAMEGVKSIFGIHVVPQLPVGLVAVKEGILSSCSDSWTVIVRGRGGHASTPHLLVDPIPVASELVMALQTIVTRKIDPKLAPVLSVTTMTTGPQETFNVTPDTVKLMGTIRSQDLGVRKFVPEQIEKMAKGICEAHGATYEFHLQLGYDMVDNDPVVTKQVYDIALKLLGTEKRIFVPKEPAFGGEDFSGYQKVVPGTFIGLGVGNEDKGTGAALHSNKFKLDEDGMPFGVSMHLGFVFENLMA